MTGRATHSGYVPSGVPAEPPAFAPQQPSSVFPPSIPEKVAALGKSIRSVSSFAELRAVIATTGPDTLIILPAKIVAELLGMAAGQATSEGGA